MIERVRRPCFASTSLPRPEATYRRRRIGDEAGDTMATMREEDTRVPYPMLTMRGRICPSPSLLAVGERVAANSALPCLTRPFSTRSGFALGREVLVLREGVPRGRSAFVLLKVQDLFTNALEL